MTTTPDHTIPPQRSWWKQPVLAAVASIAVIAVVVIAIAASRGGSADSGPDATDNAPPTATNLATPSAEAPTPTATASASGKAPAPVTAPLNGTASPTGSVSVSVPKVESVTGKPEGVGEIAGPALRFTLRLDNDTSKAIALGSVVVNAYYGADETPAPSLSGPGAKPFGSTVAAGKTATGVYVFSVPKKGRSDVTVEFSYSTDVSTVVFSGPAN